MRQNEHDSRPSPEQLLTCDRLGVDPFPAPAALKVGIAPNVRTGLNPINGLRHRPEGDTTGWYIWAGEVDPATRGDDFFVPLHIAHLQDWCPAVLPYLALPPGWRFVVAPGYEDVWYDERLLVDG